MNPYFRLPLKGMNAMRASNVGNLIMWEDEPRLCLWKHKPRSEGSILMLGIMNELITRIHISNRRKSLHSNLALLPTQKLFFFIGQECVTSYLSNSTTAHNSLGHQ